MTDRISPVTLPIPVQAVTIDLDGTLLDTIPDLAIAANAMLRELGRDELPEALIRTFVGKGINRLVERTLAGDVDGRVEDAVMQRAMPVFERLYTAVNGNHTTLYPGVLEGLETFRQRGFRLACVTNKSGRYTAPLLEAMGIASYFEITVAGDTLARKKPDPLPLLHVCRQFGIEPASLVMIGDSLNDAQAARSAGCPVFCVTYGYNEGHDVRTLDIDAIVDSLPEAASLLSKA
jgi:phosphoglycolate phosphatase